MAFPLLVVAFLGVAGAAGAALAHGRAPIWAVALVAGVPALFLHVAYFGFFQADDAFISYRYAANWADGHGPVWNAGDRVDGYTNFLWTGLLAGAAKLGLQPPTMASWGGFAAATAALGATLALASRWPERRPEGALRWHPLLAVLLLAANGSFAVWAFAGLETPLFTALITLGAYLHLREDAGEIRLPWSSLAFLAAALTRPEGLLIFGVTAAFKLYGWSRDGWSRDRMEFLLGWAALFALPYAFYFGWHWSYYGHPFPNTFYAKVGGGMDQYERGLTFLVNVGREYGVLLALFLPVPLLAWADRRRESAYLLTLLLAWAGYLLYIGGDSLALLRLFVPVLPVFYLLASAGALWVGRALWVQADRATGRRPERRRAGDDPRGDALRVRLQPFAGGGATGDPGPGGHGALVEPARGPRLHRGRRLGRNAAVLLGAACHRHAGAQRPAHRPSRRRARRPRRRPREVRLGLRAAARAAADRPHSRAAASAALPPRRLSAHGDVAGPGHQRPPRAAGALRAIPPGQLGAGAGPLVQRPGAERHCAPRVRVPGRACHLRRFGVRELNRMSEHATRPALADWWRGNRSGPSAGRSR